MKKNFIKYLIIWAAMLVFFNLAVFISPVKLFGYNKFYGAFWPSYILIMIAFIGQLICAYLFFKKEKSQDLFLNMPLLTLSYSGLTAMLIIGSLCMAIPNLPSWLGAIICSLILCMNIISIMKSQIAAELISNTEEKIKDRTAFMKENTVAAESLISGAANDEAKQSAQKVYEAFRYSDPVSSESLFGIEREISDKLRDFADEISSGKDGKEISEKLIALINERNKKCKANK